MAQNLKILGQSSPSINTLTALYTVPANTSASVSSLTICNTNNSGYANIRVSVAVGGAADNIKQYMYYNLPIDNNDTFIATIGIALATTDVVRVYSDTANVSFVLTGCEVV